MHRLSPKERGGVGGEYSVKSATRRVTRIRRVVRSPIVRKTALVMSATCGTWYIGTNIPYARWGKKAALMHAESIDPKDLASIVSKMSE